MQDSTPQDDNENIEQDRAKLERALSHPENVEAIAAQMVKIQQQATKEPPKKEPPKEAPAPAPKEARSMVASSLLAKGFLLIGVLMVGAAMATPVKTSYEVCFNPKPLLNQPKCLGVKKYRIDEDRLSEITQHSGVHAINRKAGNPILALCLGALGTVFSGAGLQASREASKEKTAATVIDRTQRRHAWTSEKIKADASIKAAHESVKHSVDNVQVINAHLVDAAATKAEFTSLHAEIASLTPELQEQFINFIALKEAQEQARIQQAQIQQARQSDPLSGLFGTMPAAPEQVAATNQPDRIASAIEVGNSIIGSMIHSDKSILIASGTGTGKTTTERYYIKEFCKKNPGAELYALLNKNDEFYGVAPERRMVFEPEDIGVKLPNGEEKELRNILKPLYDVYAIYLDRKGLPESERKRLKNARPVRCILGDWFATYQELNSRLKADDFKKVLSMLRGIITVGRDSGVGLIVDTQSPTLSSLGLVEDASIRQSLDIYGQGFVFTEEGQEKGELKTIEHMFTNKTICSASERPLIQSEYDFLSSCIKSGALKQPIIFTNVGSVPRIGIVPHLNNDVPDQQQEVVVTPAIKLSNEAQALLDFMRRTERVSASSRDLAQNYKVKGERFSTEEIKRWFNELVEADIATWLENGVIILKEE